MSHVINVYGLASLPSHTAGPGIPYICMYQMMQFGPGWPRATRKRNLPCLFHSPQCVAFN